MRWSLFPLLLLLLLILPVMASAAPPTVTITTPTRPAPPPATQTPGAPFMRIPTVAATVTGASDLAVTVTVNESGPVPASEDPNVPDRWVANDLPFETEDPLVLSNDAITVTATDSEGTTTESIVATFDDQLPVVELEVISPPMPDPNSTPFASLRVAGTMTDNDPSAVPRLFTPGQGAVTLPAGPFEKRVVLFAGLNTITAVAVDRAGNAPQVRLGITRTMVCQDPNFPITDPNAAVTSYVVNRGDDLPDADLEDDVCDVRKDLRGNPDPENPPYDFPRFRCTLRAAIQTANHHAGEDRVVLGNRMVVLTRQGPGEDAAERGDLDVTGNLRILGGSRDTSIIDARKLGDRVFDIQDGVHLQLLRLTVTGGHTPKPDDPTDAEGGGCVRSRGTLQVNDAAFLKCKSDGPGGAISIEPSLEDPNATTAMTCAIVAFSQSKTDGGGIAFADSPFALRNSTLSLNSAGRRGGAISGIGGDDPNDLVLSNVTVSRNKAKLAGGALDLGAGATAKINNCTFAENSAKAGATLSTTDDGQVEISNSILGDKKLACDPSSPEPVISMGGNVDRGESCIVSLATTGDQNDKDPKLDKLATNNGPPTHRLKVGSPAIDQAGTGPVSCEPLDARETERGDWPRSDNAPNSSTVSPPFCDAGALELFVPPPAD